MRKGTAGVDPLFYCPKGKSPSSSGSAVWVSTRKAESLGPGRWESSGPIWTGGYSSSRSGPSSGVSGARGQCDLSELPSMEWDAHSPTSASEVRSSTDRCANSPFWSGLEETLPLVGPAAADPRCCPLHPELAEIFDQAEPILISIQHLFYGL